MRSQALLLAALLFLPVWAPARPVESLSAVPSVQLPLAPSASAPQERAFGVELEYALSPSPASGSPADVPESAYVRALQIAGKPFRAGIPAVGPFGKYDSAHAMAEAVDFDGRSWQAVPEEVEGRFFDGVELVTPPLSPRRDEKALASAHAAMLASGRYRRGLSSSAHITFDVSDLIDADGNAARLVDAILFIESHWAQIYGALSPVRYGTIVNHFASPLASTHPEMLAELAALPRPDRTLYALRRIFRRHEPSERVLQRGHPGGTWKMHAANYGKLLGIGTFEGHDRPVIEFRIADLGTPEELLKARRFLAAVLSSAPSGASLEPSLPPGREWSQLNAAIAAQDGAAYEGFLRQLGLEPSAYPLLGGLGPLKSDDGDAVAAAALKAAARKTLPGGLPAALEEETQPLRIIDALLASSAMPARRLGTMALDARPDEEALPRAARLAKDPDADLRLVAVELLGRRTQSDGALPALEAALSDRNPRVRFSALFALSLRQDRFAGAVRAARDDLDDNQLWWARRLMKEEAPREPFWRRVLRRWTRTG